MKIYEIILTAIALAMDAFAVSICKGLATKKLSFKEPILCGTWFGVFQGVMPLIGFLVASLFAEYVKAFDHWIAFILLAFLGGKMIYEAIKGDENDNNSSFAFKIMIVLAIATSIDALAVGITFAFLKVNIWLAISLIGLITFALSVLGTLIGNKIGNKLGNKAEIIGGIVLILIGLKILIEHLFF